MPPTKESGTTRGFKADEVLAVVAERDALREALRGVAWSEKDGLCWCEVSQEITGKPHSAKCLAARAALERHP